MGFNSAFRGLRAKWGQFRIETLRKEYKNTKKEER
jgi:hypothetical protein